MVFFIPCEVKYQIDAVLTMLSENRQRGPSVAEFCKYSSAHYYWPVPLKQLVQISVQKLTKEL